MKNVLIFLLIAVTSSVARASMNPTPMSLYDGFGNPIASTFSGGQYYLDVSATLAEVATAAQGATRPSLMKIAGGCNTGSGLCYSLATDTSGQLYSLLKDASGNSLTSTAGSGSFVGHQGLDVSIISPISVLNPSDGPTGSAVPTDANYVGINVGGNLTGLTGTANGLRVDGSAVTQPISAASLPLPSGAATSALQTQISGQLPLSLGQKTMANSLAVVVASDQSGVPVTGTFWQATQPVSQSGAPWSQNVTQFGGSAVVTGTGASGLGIPRVTVANDSTVGLNAGSNIVGKVGIDQTTPGTTNRVQSNLDQISGSAFSLGQKTMANSAPVTFASDQTALKTYGNANAAFSQTSVTTTASTISAPANAVRVLIQGDSTNTDCIRYRFDGTAATSTVGMVAQAGQDSGQLDTTMSVSVVACSGTQKVNVQYFAQ